MRAAQELSALELRKELIRTRIAARRAQCAAAVEKLAGPLSLVDRAFDLWRMIPAPVRVAGLPLLMLGWRKLGRGLGGLGSLLRYAPLAMQFAQMFSRRPASAGNAAGNPGVPESDAAGTASAPAES